MHLDTKTRSLAELSIAERIKIVYQPIWINYPAVSKLRNIILSIAALPALTEAQCALVTAESGMGKTSLFEKATQDLQRWGKKQGEGNPVLSITLGTETSPKDIITAICAELGFDELPIKKLKLNPSFIRLMKVRNIRFLLIDELHHLLLCNEKEQRRSLVLLKRMIGSPLSISILGFGIEEALHAVTIDQQLDRRFQKFSFSRWTESEELRSFLASYERAIPLKKPSFLASKEIVKFLTNNTICTTKAIAQRLSWGAIYALLDNEEFISLEHLRQAAFFPDIMDVIGDE